jgi:DNA replication protein DnaC
VDSCSLVIHEEEGFIFLDRSAEGGSKLILLVRSFRLARRLKVSACIQRVVAKEFPRFSVEAGSPGAGKSHLAQAIGQAAIQQGYRVLYRETHALLDELAEATPDGTRKEHMEFLVTVPLLILDDLGMRKLPLTAAEELLEIIMRRYERASTMLTSTARLKTGANC